MLSSIPTHLLVHVLKISVEISPSLPLHHKRVLLVDDSPMSLKMITMLFQRLGADCVQATNGQEAVNIILSSRSAQFFSPNDDPSPVFDIVVMDNLMPIMPGQEACKKMRKIGFAGLIFGLTGHSMTQDIIDYRQAGADHIFTKPLDLVELKGVLLESAL